MMGNLFVRSIIPGSEVHEEKKTEREEKREERGRNA